MTALRRVSWDGSMEMICSSSIVGHNPVLHYVGGKYREYGSSAPPVGIVNDEAFNPSDQGITINEGSSVYISTDGITEAKKFNDKEIESNIWHRWQKINLL